MKSEDGFPRRSYETERLFRVLGVMEPDTSMTYAELSVQLGFDVTQYIPKLDYVRDALKRQAKMVIEREGGSIRRMADIEVVRNHSPRYKHKLRRAAMRGRRALESVEFDSLGVEDRIQHNAHQAGFGTIALFTRDAAHKKLVGAVERAQVRLPVDDVLRLFRK